MKKYFNKYTLTILGLSLLQSKGLNAATPAANNANSFTLSVDTVLATCALLLLFVVIALGNTLRATIQFYHQKRLKDTQKKSSTATKVLGLLALFISVSTTTLYAQDATTAAVVEEAVQASSTPNYTRWVLFFVIALELILIYVFSSMIKYFTKALSASEEELKTQKVPRFTWAVLWEKMNKFKPIEEEANIDSGHEYDGIRELDNVTPPWFKIGFALSILFAFVYMYRYHVAKTAPLQIEEYTTEVAKAKIKQEAFLKTQSNNVDENTVTVLDAAGISAGQALYSTNCVACHGDKGQGGVGPNLTDKNWLHKGGIKDIFYSIKYGWPEKGMKSWKEDFSPNQIAQLSSYVHSLAGTNVPGGKEPQGEIYDESAAASAATDAPQKE